MTLRTLAPTAQDKLRQVLDWSSGAVSITKKAELLAQLRAELPDIEVWRQIDLRMLEDQQRTRGAVHELTLTQAELQKLIDQLSAPPWFVGTFLKLVSCSKGLQALVAAGSGLRLVQIADALDPHALVKGQQVFLNGDLNVLIEPAAAELHPCGETAIFDRVLPDGRIVLKCRDEEVVADPAGALNVAELEPGQRVRWLRSCFVALENVPDSARQRFAIDNLAARPPHRIGGQRDNVRRLTMILTASLVDPQRAARYGLDGRNSVLLIGPPGCGKTSMTRLAAGEIQKLVGKRCAFLVVKPAEWESCWVGETEANIRHTFRQLHKAAADGPAILYLDEIDSIGRSRGMVANHHADAALGALLAELDGFARRGNTAIIASTNRKDLLDHALLQRISDYELVIRRPDMRGAREIFDIHLPPQLPFSPNGSKAKTTRDELIDLAVSKLYGPNADNELCTIKFRDGKSRTVRAGELVSGRLIEQISKAARQAAFERDLQGDGTGISAQDMLEAISAAIPKLASALTIRNVYSYLEDLPHDLDVVAVEPIRRRVTHPHRFERRA
jgi:ATP-dependent 26S proteasome regulatory subunit